MRNFKTHQGGQLAVEVTPHGSHDHLEVWEKPTKCDTCGHTKKGKKLFYAHINYPSGYATLNVYKAPGVDIRVMDGGYE